MTTSKNLSESNPATYRRIYQDVLDSMPRDIVQELARRRLQELEKINDHADAEGQMYGAAPPVVRV
jgi:hypothetical protein